MGTARRQLSSSTRRWTHDAILTQVWAQDQGEGLYLPCSCGLEREAMIGISMSADFKVDDQVSWNSGAGHVSGMITRVHTADFKVKGYTHHASVDAPQYEIKSSKTDHLIRSRLSEYHLSRIWS